MAPMSLATYEEARPWAKAIRERVITRQMPPWHIDPTVGVQKFKNDMSLSQAQIDTIVRWVDGGAPAGDLKDMPRPRKWPNADEWKATKELGPPDLIVKSETWTMPAHHQDVWWRPAVNTPPVLRFEEKGPSAQGPPGITVERSAKMGSPVNLTIWVEDDAKLSTSSGAPPRNLGPPVTIRWSEYRGPGTVRFENEQPVVEKLAGGTPGVHFAGKAGTTATFSAPGDYILHAVLNDYSGDGGGGFQCCWTSGKVNVKVAP